jgi:hypothetical protein
MNKETIAYYFLLITLILVFGFSTSVNILTYEMNKELNNEILELKSGLEANPDYLFSMDNTNGTGGRYFTFSSNIAIYPKGTHPYQTSLYAHHEIGHYIWYEFMNDEQREEYTKIYENADEFVTDYAKTSVEEDFAETVMESVVITMDYDKLPRDRQDFMKKKISRFVIS